MKYMPGKTAAALLASLLFTSGCGNSGAEHTGKADSAASSAEDGTALLKSSQSSGKGRPSAGLDGGQEEGLVALNWQKAGRIPEIEAWSGLPSGADVVMCQPVEDFSGIQVTFYTKSGDEDYVYADLSTSRGHFNLGFTGTYNYRKPGDMTAESVSLFADRMLKITGGLGANTSLSSYYKIDAAGMPSGMLQVDTGHTREVDADGDGWTEAVSAHGTPMTAYIYRWRNGYAEEAYLNDDLQADSVMLREDLIFEASNAGETEVREYRLLPAGLIPVKPPIR